MVNAHQISEYINDISFKESLGMGYNPDEVYEVICNLSSMYNQVLSDAYKENDELKTKVEMLEKQELQKMSEVSAASIAKMGRCENVTTDVLLRICEALDCKVEDIMERVPCKKTESMNEKSKEK